MMRTQVQLDETAYVRLREVAMRQHRSMAACIRDAVEQFIGQADGSADDLSDVLGRFQPIPLDDLKEHDRIWAQSALRKSGRR